MPNLICPNCKALAHFPVANRHEGTPNAKYVITAPCASCGYIIMIYSNDPQANDVKDYFPKGLSRAATDPAVPNPIADDFAEALKCREVKAFKATAAMCRRAVQGTAIQLGAPKGWARDQIDWLADNRKITPLLQTAAHQVRVFGNTGAHPGEDGLDEVTESEADDAILLTEELLDHVFAVAARLGMTPKGEASTE